MIKSEVTELKTMRIIRYDAVIMRGTAARVLGLKCGDSSEIISERHTISVIPKDAMGELCPLKSICFELDGGVWTLRKGQQTVREFTCEDELFSYAKMKFRSMRKAGTHKYYN